MNKLKISLSILMLSSSMYYAQAQQPANNAIDKITNAYLDVKNALFAGNGDLAEKDAKVLLAALSDNPDKGLSPEQRKQLNSYIDKLKFDSRHISEVNMVPHQREHFASLSKNLYGVLKALKMNTVTLYEQYCPMKKTYWISETTAIKNPYYGSEMPECGITKETLKP